MKITKELRKMKALNCMAILSFLCAPNLSAWAFFLGRQNNSVACPPVSTALYGKGGSSARKQAALRDMMAKAKALKNPPEKVAEGDDVGGEAVVVGQMSDEEIRAANDRKRFDFLLDNEASIMYAESGNRELEERMAEELASSSFGKGAMDMLFAGDPAPVLCWHDLVQNNGLELGKSGAERILSRGVTMVLVDPRVKSSELRSVLRSLVPDIGSLGQFAVVTPDSPSENRRAKKKGGFNDFEFLSDEKREWMRSYTALGTKRYELGFYILEGGKIKNVFRGLNVVTASASILDAIRSS